MSSQINSEPLNDFVVETQAQSTILPPSEPTNDSAGNEEGESNDSFHSAASTERVMRYDATPFVPSANYQTEMTASEEMPDEQDS